MKVYDIECLPNFFSYTDLDINTAETNTFVIHESRNESQDFIKYLHSVTGMIGFNNMGYDYPILHYFLNDIDFFPIYSDKQVASETTRLLRVKSDEIIKSDNRPTIWNPNIPQLDLYLIHHFNNRNRATSLKDIQFNMHWENVQGMPIRHDAFIKEEQIVSILEYNLNDVLSTYEFFKLSIPKIEFRNQLNKKYKYNFNNSSDVGIGSKIVLMELERKTGMTKSDLMAYRKDRDKIYLSDCIRTSVRHDIPEFVSLVQKIQKKVIGLKNPAYKPKFKNSVFYKGFRYDFALGGIHGAKRGIYVSDTQRVIKTFDVESLYPSGIINKEITPSHIGYPLIEIAKEMKNTRVIAKKEGDTVTNETFKLALNGGIFGKFGEETSPLRDYLCKYQTTISCQIDITVLTAKLQEVGFELIMINTDGAEFIIPNARNDEFMKICNEWSEKTNFKLEHNEYQKLVIIDVNNYLALYQNV